MEAKVVRACLGVSGFLRRQTHIGLFGRVVDTPSIAVAQRKAMEAATTGFCLAADSLLERSRIQYQFCSHKFLSPLLGMGLAKLLAQSPPALCSNVVKAVEAALCKIVAKFSARLKLDELRIARCEDYPKWKTAAG